MINNAFSFKYKIDPRAFSKIHMHLVAVFLIFVWKKKKLIDTQILSKYGRLISCCYVIIVRTIDYVKESALPMRHVSKLVCVPVYIKIPMN